jgi:hypothetical protein
MKISGHSNIESLSKYISLNELDVVENLKKLALFSEKKETKKEKIKSRQKWINYLDYPPGDVATGKVL